MKNCYNRVILPFSVCNSKGESRQSLVPQEQVFVRLWNNERDTFFELYGRLLHQTTGEDAEIMAVW